MADKVTEVLVEVLKQALAEPQEQRLYKSGKLPGLFPAKTGAHGDAATRALREGLIEVARTETKGKTVSEWVRITPRGVQFLHEHESPEKLLSVLRDVLATARSGIPAWQTELQQQLDDVSRRVTDMSRLFLQRLESLTVRVEEALKQLQNRYSGLPDFLVEDVPWALDVLAYVERRRADRDCVTLPELFTALVAIHPDLSLPAFHAGLRRLQEHRALRLLPFDRPAEELPQPEYALFDGGAVLYFASRWQTSPRPHQEETHALSGAGLENGHSENAGGTDGVPQGDPRPGEQADPRPVE